MNQINSHIPCLGAVGTSRPRVVDLESKVFLGRCKQFAEWITIGRYSCAKSRGHGFSCLFTWLFRTTGGDAYYCSFRLWTMLFVVVSINHLKTNNHKKAQDDYYHLLLYYQLAVCLFSHDCNVSHASRIDGGQTQGAISTRRASGDKRKTVTSSSKTV